MFIATLFTVVKKLKQFKHHPSTDKRTNTCGMSIQWNIQPYKRNKAVIKKKAIPKRTHIV